MNSEDIDNITGVFVLFVNNLFVYNFNVAKIMIHKSPY